MEESRALKKLQEAADLIGMIEDLTSTTGIEKISPASWAGLKITLRNVRESLVQSHDVLANDLVHRARGSAITRGVESRPEPSILSGSAKPADSAAIPSLTEAQKQSLITRKDLRTSLEKFVGQGTGNT